MSAIECSSLDEHCSQYFSQVGSKGDCPRRARMQQSWEEMCSPNQDSTLRPQAQQANTNKWATETAWYKNSWTYKQEYSKEHMLEKANILKGDRLTKDADVFPVVSLLMPATQKLFPFHTPFLLSLVIPIF